MTDPQSRAGPETEPQTITFHYIKSTQFRVAHADGAFGGITPRGLIMASFYSERQPLPRSTVQSISAEGTLGQEIRERRVQRDGPVREIESAVIMDLTTAKAFHDWLGQKIAELERGSTENTT